MTLTIHPLNVTRIAVDGGMMTYLRNYGTRLWLACPVYIIRGGSEPVICSWGPTPIKPINPLISLNR